MAYQQNEAFRQQLTSFVSTPNQFFGKKFEDVVKMVTGTYKREMRARPAPFGPAKTTFYPVAPKFKNWCYLHMEVRGKALRIFSFSNSNQILDRPRSMRRLLG